jgi:signal transduction histidine kinase
MSERSQDGAATGVVSQPAPFDVSTAAHQLRAPLTAITGFAELLISDESWIDPTMRHDLLASILESAAAQSLIIERWLDAGEVGHSTPVTEDVLAVRSEVEDLLVNIEPLLVLHPIQLEVPSDLRVVADKGALAAVLSNLVTNAAKYCPAGSPITIRGEATDGFVTVTVHNEGDGVEDDELERIFARGYRAEPSSGSTTDGDENGSGLGLGIARELITQLGGRIWAESGATGTDFAFTLPAAAAH